MHDNKNFPKSGTVSVRSGWSNWVLQIGDDSENSVVDANWIKQSDKPTEVNKWVPSPDRRSDSHFLILKSVYHNYSVFLIWVRFTIPVLYLNICVYHICYTSFKTKIHAWIVWISWKDLCLTKNSDRFKTQLPTEIWSYLRW